MRSLTIISHTEHYRSSSGTIVGLASTVMEINQLLQIFDRIEHVAMLHGGEPSANTMAYASENIKLIPLPALGGTSLTSKLDLVRHAPKVLRIIKNSLNRTDYYQFRAPTGIGVFVIPFLMAGRELKGWYKYAGNWKQAGAPKTYQFQRWLLRQQSKKVTINGLWNDQPEHCLSFENPCLTQKELKLGEASILNKAFRAGCIELCFVGRLEPAKGLDLFFEALKELQQHELSKIARIHMVGEGSNRKFYEVVAETLGIPISFHGLLKRSQVFEIFRQCHAIVLPSQSEGFPKVIAEAMAFGCLPIVSKVSSIAHYITHGKNGLLIHPLNAQQLIQILLIFLNMPEHDYKKSIHSPLNNLYRFTYSYYNTRIANEIL